MMGLEAEELWVCPCTSKDLGKSFAFSGPDILITAKEIPAFCMSEEMVHTTECCELWRANSYRGWPPPRWVLIIHTDCLSSDTHLTESEAWIWIYDVQRIRRLLSFLCKLVTYSKFADWFHLLLTYLLIKISSVALILNINTESFNEWKMETFIENKSNEIENVFVYLRIKMPTIKSCYCVWDNVMTISDRSVVTWTPCRRNFQFV